MKRQPRHKLASSLILNYLSTFLKKLSHGYDKPRRRLIRDVIVGILMSASVKISLMVKYIEDNCQSLRSREKRISRQLMSLRWDEDVLIRNHLQRASSFIDDFTVIAVDISDISKRYGYCFEYMSRVYDESSDSFVDGYWFLIISAVIGKGKQVVLYAFPFGSKVPGFESQTKEIEKGVSKVAQVIGNKGLWVMDRGFDSILIFSFFSAFKLRFLVRIYKDRSISGGKRLIKIGESMSLPYSREIVVKRWNGRRRKKENVLVSFGFREIQFEERWNPYTRRREALELTLLVFEGVYKQGERSYFITSEKVENPEP
jgi:hypothetical protein